MSKLEGSRGDKQEGRACSFTKIYSRQPVAKCERCLAFNQREEQQSHVRGRGRHVGQIYILHWAERRCASRDNTNGIFIISGCIFSYLVIYILLQYFSTRHDTTHAKLTADIALPSRQLPSPFPHVYQQRPEGLAIRSDAALAYRVDPAQPRRDEEHAAGGPARGGTDERKQAGDVVLAVEQDAQGLDVVGDDGPAERARGRGHVVLPDDHEDGEELGRRRHEERRRDGVGAAVAREEAEQVQRRERGADEEADAGVEGDGRDGAEDYCAVVLLVCRFGTFRGSAKQREPHTEE